MRTKNNKKSAFLLLQFLLVVAVWTISCGTFAAAYGWLCRSLHRIQRLEAALRIGHSANPRDLDANVTVKRSRELHNVLCKTGTHEQRRVNFSYDRITVNYGADGALSAYNVDCFEPVLKS